MQGVINSTILTSFRLKLYGQSWPTFSLVRTTFHDEPETCLTARFHGAVYHIRVEQRGSQWLTRVAHGPLCKSVVYSFSLCFGWYNGHRRRPQYTLGCELALKGKQIALIVHNLSWASYSRAHLHVGWRKWGYNFLFASLSSCALRYITHSGFPAAKYRASPGNGQLLMMRAGGNRFNQAACVTGGKAMCRGCHVDLKPAKWND